MENLQEKYFNTRRLLQNTNEMSQAIKQEELKNSDDIRKVSIKSSEFDNLVEIANSIDERKARNNLLQNILINNLLSIQQDLLQIALDYFKENYKNKRLGEKTKQKYKNEIVNLISKNYNIDVYCYLMQRITYNNTTEYTISIYYKDYYYNSTLKNEKVIYNITKDEDHQYYYNKIDYVDTNNIDQYAEKLYQNFTNYHEELKTLEKKLNDKIDTNNSLCVGALSYKRYNHIYLKQG